MVAAQRDQHERNGAPRFLESESTMQRNLFAMRHPDRVWALVAVDSISGYYHMPETDGLTTAIFMSSIGLRGK